MECLTLLFDKRFEAIFEDSILNDKIIFSSLNTILESYTCVGIVREQKF